MNSRNTINSILAKLSKETPIIVNDDIVETVKTLYPSYDIPKDKKNIEINGVEMTMPFCASQETKKMLQKDNSPLLEIYKDLDRGDILSVKEIGNNKIVVENMSVKEEFRRPFNIEKLDIIKGNFSVIRRRSIDLIKTLERLEGC